MTEAESMGALSLLPAGIAIVLAFATRNTIFSLASACLIGVLVAGEGLIGFPNLLKNVLGTTAFSWIFLLELFIGVTIAFFQRTGAIANFSRWVEGRTLNRMRVQLIAWVMGMFVFFSDYFSPLFVGATMRDLSDRYRISREKLAYIADSTSAPVSVLVPVTGWAVFIAGLLIGMGPVEDAVDAMAVFVASIPYNFYALLAVAMVGLIAARVIPDFGPMATAETRAQETGKVFRDGAEPLMGEELTEIQVFPGIRTSLLWNFVLPVLVVIGGGDRHLHPYLHGPDHGGLSAFLGHCRHHHADTGHPAAGHHGDAVLDNWPLAPARPPEEALGELKRRAQLAPQWQWVGSGRVNGDDVEDILIRTDSVATNDTTNDTKSDDADDGSITKSLSRYRWLLSDTSAPVKEDGTGAATAEVSWRESEVFEGSEVLLFDMDEDGFVEALIVR